LRVDKVKTKERVVVVVSGRRMFDSGGGWWRRIRNVFNIFSKT
jgi:dihydrofolate reductase